MINETYNDQYKSKHINELNELTEKSFCLKNSDNFCLSEIDFYPPADKRELKSLIKDLYYDTFADYTEYIFDLYEEEDWYEN